jgi:hypothetical protein
LWVALSEDYRAAVTVTVSLVNQLITAALGLVAVQAAFLAFVLNSHDVEFWPFGFLVGGAFLALLGSVGFGALGIDETASRVADGTWHPATRYQPAAANQPAVARQSATAQSTLKWQTILEFVGLGCVLLSFYFNGTPKQDATREAITVVRSRLDQAIGEMNRVELEVQSVSARTDGLELRVSNRCDAVHQPQFAGGFAALKSALGDIMGAPLTCEYADPQGTGDVLQNTTSGLAFWRKWSNMPTFTDGYRHWAVTPAGIVMWSGQAPDPRPNCAPELCRPQPSA